MSTKIYILNLNEIEQVPHFLEHLNAIPQLELDYKNATDKIKALKQLQLRYNFFNRCLSRIKPVGQISDHYPILIASLLQEHPDLSQKARLGYSFFSPEKLEEHIHFLTQLLKQSGAQTDADLIQHLMLARKALEKQSYLFEILDDTKLHNDFNLSSELTLELPETKIVTQKVNDSGGRTFPAEEAILSAIKKARAGEPASVNLSHFDNINITKALHNYVFRQKPHFAMLEIPIVYDDGSQARPIKFSGLDPLPDEELQRLQQSLPSLNIGQLSIRHPEMDHLVDMYWFNNFDISGKKTSAAETDELCFTKSLDLLEGFMANGGVQINFYQTGLPGAVISFYRAITETLYLHRGKLLVTPVFFSGKYYNGPIWA